MGRDTASTPKGKASDRENNGALIGTEASDTSKRMTVYLPAETARMLEVLSKLQSISLNEAIRRAISTESFIQNEIQNNKSRLLLETQDGKTKELIFR
ncbi:MAG: hypothetical protein F6K19_23380 [Cyanothece sp. SIO1E1]|nr:hypothetical protein [Cyanothece sp. SIO1E1]